MKRKVQMKAGDWRCCLYGKYKMRKEGRKKVVCPLKACALLTCSQQRRKTLESGWRLYFVCAGSASLPQARAERKWLSNEACLLLSLRESF